MEILNMRKKFVVHKFFIVIICFVVWINVCCAQLNDGHNDDAVDDDEIVLVTADNMEFGLQEQYTTLSPENNQFEIVTEQFIPETTRKRKKPRRKRKRKPNQQRLQQLEPQPQRENNQSIELPTSEPLVLVQPDLEQLDQEQIVIYEPLQNVPSEPQVDKSYRRPYSEARRKETENNDQSSAADLKNILKNAGGLSLSEILQQRNLSLADLLKGKQIAIAAITQPTKLESDEPKITKYVSKPETIRRLPNLSRPTSESNTSSDLVHVFTTQPAPLDQNDDLAIESSNRIPPTIPNLRDHFSKTDRPIKEVIPSIRPDLSNSNTKRLANLFANRKNNDRIPVNYKEKINKLRPTTTIDNSETTTLEYEPTISTITSTSTVHNKFKPLRPRLRLNSQGMLVTKISSSATPTATTTTSTTTTEIPTTVTTSIRPRKVLKNYVEPLENLLKQFRPKKLESHENPNQDHTQRSFIDYDNEDFDVTEINPSLFSDITSVKSVDDRTDLLELMEDRRNGARLVKVLSQRNMTLDELIEHRKRGSSQLHLSEIFYNKTVPLNNHKLNVTPDKMDVVTAFETFPEFDLETLKSVKPDEIKTDSQGASYFTSIFDIKPTDEAYKEGRSMKMNKKMMEVQDVMPTIKSTTTRSLEFDDSIFTEIEDVDNSLSRVNGILDLELSGHDYRKNSISSDTPVTSSIPIGIKSAILASSCIVVISVLMFVLIFVACRWRQNRNNKLEYHEESFKGRSKAPILERNLSNCSTSPTLYQMSRSNKLNTMDPNSPEVQDYLYDAMRHPF